MDGEGSGAGSGSGSGSGSASATAAGVWAAVAAARTWISAAYYFASWSMYKEAWNAMTEAATAGRNAADAGVQAVGRDNRMNIVAFGNATDSLRAALRAQKRTRTAFAEAAAHAGTSAAEGELAAKAHAMAGNKDGEREMRGQAEHSRRMAEAAAEWASMAGTDARSAKRALRKWTSIAAEWSDGEVWPGDRAAWVGGQESIRADAEYCIARWSDAAARADDAVKAAAGDLLQHADAAQKAYVKVGRGRGPMPPDALDAKAALDEAVEAAKRSAEMRPPPGLGRRRRPGGVQGDRTA